MIKFITYLFYRYYSTGPRKDVAYLSSILAMSLLFYIHFFQLLILFGGTNVIPSGGKSEISSWIKMALFLSPIFLIFRLLFKEIELKELEYDERKVKNGYIWLIVYIIFSVAFLILLILYKKEKI